MNLEKLKYSLWTGLVGMSLLAIAGSATAQDAATVIAKQKAARAKAFQSAAAAPAPPAPTGPIADEVKAPSPVYLKDVQARVNRNLLAAGKVTTVEDGKKIVVDDALLKMHAGRSAIFYEAARPHATVAPVPAVLQQAAGPTAVKQATLLREDVIVPTSAGDSTRLQTFVHDETGLTYVGARNQFEGRFAVALSPVEPNGTVTLSNPKKMSVRLPGGALIAPIPELVISKIDEWTPVTFSVKQPGKSYYVSVSASTGDNGDPVEVQVIAPSINLATDQSFVPGYGLGTFIVSVSAPDLVEPKGAQITFQADGGIAESGNVVTLDENGHGTLKMRSVGSGTVVVRALPPFESASVTVVFKNPWLLLVLAVLGGVVGAVLMRKGRAKWSTVVRVGALTGLAMTVLYYVGLDWVVRATGWTTLASAGEAVAFALGLLGALVGMGVITAGAAKKE